MYRPFLVVFLVLLSTGCQPAAQEVRVVKVGLAHGPSHSFTQALARFAEEVEAQSRGRFDVRIYDGARLGSEASMQEMLTIGSLEMTVTGVLTNYEPLFAVFEMPYLYHDRAHVQEVMEGPVVAEVAESLHEKGLRLVGFYENGFRHITNSVRPIERPEDVAGLMIRTPENPAQIETFRALGAIPTPLAFSELYTALLQGVVDGQENPLQNIWYGRLLEAQDHLALTRHIYNAAYVLASQRFWQSLSEEDRALLRDALHASTEWQLAYMVELDKELEAKLQAEGMRFTHPDPAAFETATRSAYDALFQRLGPRAEAIVEAIR